MLEINNAQLESEKAKFPEVRYFLSDSLVKTASMVQHLDTQTNILIGLSTAVFVFSITQSITDERSLTFIILSICSAFSAILGLFAIHPPKSMRKRGQHESLMYNKKIASFDTSEAFVAKIQEIVWDQKVLIAQYAIESFNMAKYYYRPKRLLFKYSRNTLLLGIVLSLIAFFASM